METQTGHLLPSYKAKRKKNSLSFKQQTITRQIRRDTFCQETVISYNKKQNHSARLAQNNLCGDEQ